MRTTTKLFLLLPFIFSCNGQQSAAVKTLEAKDFSDKIQSASEATIIDVRTPGEYSSGHIENAVNIDWNNSEFATKTASYDKTKPIFVYCKGGSRSSDASEKLAKMGFTKIYNLQGGFLKWEAAGLSNPDKKQIGISRAEYDKLLISDKKVLINFFATWCGPCKKMEPYILKMQKEMKSKITIIRLDADENKSMMEELKLDQLPVLLLYDKKDLKWSHFGFISEEDLKKQL